MSYYIGIDLGTSAVKTLLLSENGIEKIIEKSYCVYSSLPNYSEQSPDDWYKETINALEELLVNKDKTKVKSISFSGQMHGLVMLDENDNVIRPAILWNDGRSTKEVEYLNNQIGKEYLLKHTGNIAFAGFTAPKLLWVKNNEPDHFGKISKIMLPKDYLAYMLSGSFATDVSDASGTLYFDVQNRKWSAEMLELIGINESCLPKVFESNCVIGTLKSEIAEKLGIGNDVKIIIGAGDNAASAIGNGIVNNGECNISLGTSGTIFVETNKFSHDSKSAIHSFCSASKKYHFLACILSAASAQKWWLENILQTNYDTSGFEKYLGESNVLFLPYLTGERSPINDENAKAMFIGMTPNTTREEMSLAVIEGVAFALRENLDIIKKMGIKITSSKICGGGARNKLWLKIIANVLNITLEIPSYEQGGALGAALLAAKGVLNEDDYILLANKFYKIKETIKPDIKLVSIYDSKYREFLKLYPMQQYLKNNK